MVQTAEPGHRYNLAASYGIRSCFTTGWRTLSRERCNVDPTDLNADRYFGERQP